jgi:hypothetical protein
VCSSARFPGAAWVPSAVLGAAGFRSPPLLSDHESTSSGVSSVSDSSSNLRAGGSSSSRRVIEAIAFNRTWQRAKPRLRISRRRDLYRWQD